MDIYYESERSNQKIIDFLKKFSFTKTHIYVLIFSELCRETWTGPKSFLSTKRFELTCS